MNLFKIPLTLSYQEVLPFLGMEEEPTRAVKELIEHYLRKIRRLAQPVGTWQTFSVLGREPEKTSLHSATLIIAGTSTAAHFKTCEKITLLATTLGGEVDHLLLRLSPQEPTKALIADAVASGAIEWFTEQFDRYLAEQIRHKGYFPTARFSPGYGDWPLNWQKEFLADIKGEQIGLTTTEYFLLQPTKSITAAIGWSNIPVNNTSQPALQGEDKSAQKPAKPCSSAQTCPYCPFASSCSAHYQQKYLTNKAPN